MYIYINGKIIKEKEAFISVFDHGFMYGLGVFETFRVYNGHYFLVDDHIKRLNESLEVLHISKKYTRDEVICMLDALLEKNHLSHAYIRFNISAGIGELGLQTESYLEPNTIIYAKPLASATELTVKKATILRTERNTPEGKYRLKSHHYLNNILAKREIAEQTNVEGIFLTKEGFIAEGIVTNIFWVKGNTLYTPSLETGILNGVTRQFVLTLAKQLNLDITEGLHRKEDLFESDEVFVTNSIQEIIAINNIDGYVFQGLAGNVVQTLYKLYKSATETIFSREEWQ